MAASRARIAGFAALAAWAAWLGGCDPLGRSDVRDQYYVSIRLDSSQYAFDLRVLLVEAGTSDTLDTVFTGRARDSSDLERLPARRFRGGPVDAVIWASRNGQFQWYEILKYRIPGEAPERQKVTRRKFEPVLSLPPGSGQDTVFLAVGEAPALDTPACLGYRKEKLKVEVTDSLDTRRPGRYSIRYACEDAFGFRSEGARSFRVIPPDSLGPFLTWVGRDTSRSIVGERPRPPLMSCEDYKRRALQIRAEGFVDSLHLGYYPVVYSCRDTAGRTASARRVFVVAPARGRFALLRATQETGIDVEVGRDNQNIGFNGWLPLTKLPDKGFYSFIQFDLERAQALNPGNARLRLHAFGTGYVYPNQVYRCRFEVWAFRSPWTEGHGNAFYYDGAWRNKGDTIFLHYPLADSIKALSRNPVGADGLPYSARDLVLEADSLGADTVALAMTPVHGLRIIPKPESLLTVELDVSRYVRTAAPRDHHGFMVLFTGTPDGRGLGFLTKEAGDGSYAPELVIEY
jgi:hypothetical protein